MRRASSTLASDHQQPCASPDADDCFARAKNPAELTIELATDRPPRSNDKGLDIDF